MSNRLTCRPLKHHDFQLTKGELRDAVYLQYNWLLPRLPSYCSCGAVFTIARFSNICHNQARDITAALLQKVMHNVVVEPHLQSVTVEQFRFHSAISEDQAQLDMAANGIWGSRFERTIINVRVFNPHAPSNCTTSLASTYARHEKEKRRCY